MRSLRKVFFWLLLSVSLWSCSSNKRCDYDRIKHISGKTIVIKTIDFNSLKIDASETSLTGHWLMRDSLIYFIDKYVVGVKIFNTSGNFIANQINQGRGPNELTAPAWITSINSDGDMAIMDSDNILYNFNKYFIVKTNFNFPWIGLLSKHYNNKLISALYLHPNPEIPEMYEYNYVVDNMLSNKDTLYIPIITEHVSYNGYDVKCNSKKFWRDSYIFVSFSMSDISGSKRLFGHYPPVYHNQNIPIFSTYDFAIAGNKLYVSFSADSRIYVMSLNGRLLYSIGCSDPGIKGRYPQTYTFDRYDKEFDKQRLKYGFYDRLYASGNILFRTCRLDNGKWKLQIYKDENMIGDILMDNQLRVFGNYKGWFYGYIEVDAENECFKLVKFEIKS